MTTKAISVIPLFLLSFSFKLIFPPLLRYFYAPFKKRQKSDTNRPIKIYISLGLFVSLYLIYFFLLLNYPCVCVCVCVYSPKGFSVFYHLHFPYLFFLFYFYKFILSYFMCFIKCFFSTFI